MQNLTDYNSEQIIIGSLLQNPKSVYYKCDDYISGSDLFYLEHQIIYDAVEQLVSLGIESISKPDILNRIKSTNPKADDKFDFNQIFSELRDSYVSNDNLQKYCQKISSLNFARKLQNALNDGIKNINNITGEEKLSEILNIAEKPIQDCTESLVYDSEMVDINSIIEDYIEYLATERPENKGIPTGFPIFDKLIGRGLVKPGVHLIGGRSKSGKSFMACQVAVNVARLGIPVLYLDTELTKEIVMDRLLACISDVEIDTINTGLFQDSEESLRKVSNGLKEFKDLKITYRNISGTGHAEWMSTIRRWIIQNVGFNEDGTTKDCLIILDYIKTMDLKELGKFSEWQYLGQVITDLHNLCIKYSIPILSFTQLNRDGIANEGQGVISGSDRLIFLCSSFSIMKKKEPEDMTSDPPVNLPNGAGSGDRKLIIVASRFGKGTGDGEYINLITDLSKAKIIEGKTNVQNRVYTKKSKTEVVVNNFAGQEEYEEAPF